MYFREVCCFERDKVYMIGIGEIFIFFLEYGFVCLGFKVRVFWSDGLEVRKEGVVGDRFGGEVSL